MQMNATNISIVKFNRFVTLADILYRDIRELFEDFSFKSIFFLNSFQWLFSGCPKVSDFLSKLLFGILHDYLRAIL